MKVISWGPSGIRPWLRLPWLLLEEPTWMEEWGDDPEGWEEDGALASNRSLIESSRHNALNMNYRREPTLLAIAPFDPLISYLSVLIPNSIIPWSLPTSIDKFDIWVMLSLGLMGHDIILTFLYKSNTLPLNLKIVLSSCSKHAFMLEKICITTKIWGTNDWSDEGAMWKLSPWDVLLAMRRIPTTYCERVWVDHPPI